MAEGNQTFACYTDVLCKLGDATGIRLLLDARTRDKPYTVHFTCTQVSLNLGNKEHPSLRSAYRPEIYHSCKYMYVPLPVPLPAHVYA